MRALSISRPLAALVFATLATRCALVERRPTPPAGGFDVLLVTVDSFRPDHIGAYGYPRSITPVLDRLASRGIRFTNAYATGHWTVPSLISLATGLYPASHGVEGRGRSLSPAADTLGDRLRAHGYRVFAYEIEDVFAGIGFDRLPDPDRDGVKSLETIAKEAAPFFCWLHVKKPHLPYRAGEPWESALRRAPPPAEGEAALRYWAVRNGNILPRGRLAFEAADLGWIEDLYDAEVAAQDARIGEFFATLERVGRAERTIVVVTADHGEELLDHGQVGHASTTYDSTPFEELIRIPMIIAVPGWRAGAGAVVAAPVQLHDLMPTLLELLGVPRGDSAPEAISLVPLLERRAGGRSVIFASGAPCGYNCSDERWDDRIHVASDLRWKLVRFAPASGPTREVLFDLVKDPNERRPLAADRPEARELRDSLDAALGRSRELRARIGEPLRFAAPTPKPAAEIQLRPGGPPNPNPG